MDYKREDKGETVDVAINYEPFTEMMGGKRLTVVWVQDVYRAAVDINVRGSVWDVMIRGHAGFYKHQVTDVRGKDVFWIPQATDTNIFKRSKHIKKKHDLVFVGKGRPNKELEFLKRKFGCAILGDCHSYNKYIDLMSEGRIVVNIPAARETQKRVMESMAIGPALMSWGPDYELLLREDYHYIKMPHEGVDPGWEQFSKKLTALLKDQDKLNLLALRGRELVESKFTFDKQLDRLEEILRWKLLT